MKYVIVGLTLLFALLSPPSQAEQWVDQGPWRVHYAAMASRDLTPAVARQFGVTRSAKRGLLVLNAQRVSGVETTPVAATGNGTVRSLGWQQPCQTRRGAPDQAVSPPPADPAASSPASAARISATDWARP